MLVNIHMILHINTIRTFGEDIYEGKITLEEADEDQSDLADQINKLLKKQDQKIMTKNKKKNCYRKLA